MTWHPILEGELLVRARAVIAQISDDVPNHRPRDAGSLNAGAAGIAIFYAYARRDELAAAFLDRAVDVLAEEDTDVGLHGGFSGVAWAVAHMQAMRSSETSDSDEDPDDDPNAAIDETLLQHLRRTPWTEGYDLISGLAGIAVYALERRGYPLAEPLLNEIVSRSQSLAEPMTEGLSILSPPETMLGDMRAQYPEGAYNVGVAHGIPGLIGILGSVGGPSANSLRRGLAAWLSSVIRAAPDGSLLPYQVDKRDPDGRAGCRAGWCYGDPGVAAALLRSARESGDSALETLALQVGRAAAKRSITSALVRDAGLCHGAAGLLHLFNRLYQATGEACFREAAITWAGETLALQKSDGVAGYQAYRPHSGAEWRSDPGVLTGAAGIGLALLAATSDVEPRWDRMFVCDVEPLD